MQRLGTWRSQLRSKSATTFAPGAITNFFQIHYDSSGNPDSATGGGYILSKGTHSAATFVPQDPWTISTVVNGDPAYNARTTRRALELLTASADPFQGRLVVRQTVGTPIGSGFGASGSSAVSAVLAANAVLGLKIPKSKLALFAHQAEITERTGLGTVSVVYRGTGAGAITEPGIPGVARFRTVKVPKDLRIVTAYLAPYDKKDALGSKSISERIDRLGRRSLSAFLDDPALETLASEGERFSGSLGLESPEVKKLIDVAKSSGAFSASQNMIGYAIHALTDRDRIRRVQASLKQTAPEARIDVFSIGKTKAGIQSPSRR